jgi:hypothetical protein
MFPDAVRFDSVSYPRAVVDDNEGLASDFGSDFDRCRYWCTDFATHSGPVARLATSYFAQFTYEEFYESLLLLRSL